MQVSFSSEALADAEEAVSWYMVKAGPAISRAFTQALQRAVNLAVTQPGIASPGPHGTVSLYLKRFPYTLVFRVQSANLRVIAIAHQSRRPGYWIGRR